MALYGSLMHCHSVTRNSVWCTAIKLRMSAFYRSTLQWQNCIAKSITITFWNYVHRKTGLLVIAPSGNEEFESICKNMEQKKIPWERFSKDQLMAKYPEFILNPEDVVCCDNNGGVLYADKALRSVQVSLSSPVMQIHLLVAWNGSVCRDNYTPFYKLINKAFHVSIWVQA